MIVGAVIFTLIFEAKQTMGRVKNVLCCAWSGRSLPLVAGARRVRGRLNQEAGRVLPVPTAPQPLALRCSGCEAAARVRAVLAVEAAAVDADDESDVETSSLEPPSPVAARARYHPLTEPITSDEKVPPDPIVISDDKPLVLPVVGSPPPDYDIRRVLYDDIARGWPDCDDVQASAIVAAVRDLPAATAPEIAEVFVRRYQLTDAKITSLQRCVADFLLFEEFTTGELLRLLPPGRTLADYIEIASHINAWLSDRVGHPPGHPFDG